MKRTPAAVTNALPRMQFFVGYASKLLEPHAPAISVCVLTCNHCLLDPELDNKTKGEQRYLAVDQIAALQASKRMRHNSSNHPPCSSTMLSGTAGK
jgi:hypothetical protein